MELTLSFNPTSPTTMLVKSAKFAVKVGPEGKSYEIPNSH